MWQPTPAQQEALNELDIKPDCESLQVNWAQVVAMCWQREDRGKLKARAQVEDAELADPCITPPEARYRGAENQLYRVEVHRAGPGWDGADGNRASAATFKWSRDNGSVVFPLYSPAIFSTSPSPSDPDRVTDTATVTLEHLGRDGRSGLAVDDWVELVDDDYTLRWRAEPLWQVDAIDPIRTQVTLRRDRPSGSEPPDVGLDVSKHPLLRRWDHRAGDPAEGAPELDAGGALIEEGAGDQGWLVLEDGVQVQFQPGGNYRSGDYWLIPARTATGDVEWPPSGDGGPEPLPPHGVEHAYAPLWIISYANGQVTAAEEDDCRRKMKDLALLSLA